jgi:hypothetical protein
VEVCGALERLGIPHEVAAGERLMLQGCLEAAGEPVDVRIAPGTAGAVQDAGILWDGEEWRLVCADVDGEILTRGLLAAVRAEIAGARARALERELAGEVDVTTTVEADGGRRLLLRPRRS